jgi:hypothetical protein
MRWDGLDIPSSLVPGDVIVIPDLFSFCIYDQNTTLGIGLRAGP